MTHQTLIEGNLTADPDQIRYAGDVPVLNINVAVNSREKFNGQWQDGEPTFYRVAIWRDQAVNAAESLRKGTSVMVYGTVKSKSWEKDGQRRTSLEMEAIVIGPSLRWQTAQVARVNRKQDGGQSGGFGGSAGGAGAGGWGNDQPAQDPWGGQPSGGGSWGAPQDNNPPY